MSATMVVAKTARTSIRRCGRRRTSRSSRRRPQDPKVERIFVNAAIKKALCRDAGSDRGWLRKVRPMVGTRLSFPRPHGLPGGQSRMHGRRTRRRPATAAARSSTGGSPTRSCNPKPAPKPKPTERQAEAEAGDHDGRSAGGLPAGAAGAVEHGPVSRSAQRTAPIAAISASVPRRRARPRTLRP